MTADSDLTIDTGPDDIIIPFQVGESAVRGRIIRLGTTIDEILSRHPFPDPVQALVGEAATMAALLGAALKFDGKLILQVQGDGPVPMVVADYTVGGGLRATASLKDEHRDEAAAAQGPELHYLLRKGQMVITIDQGAEMERYQGVVPLEGPTIAKATIGYFAQSEQIPTAIELAIGRVSNADGNDVWRAGGIMIQFVPGEGGTRERGEDFHLADDDREAWNRAAMLLETTKADELLDPTVAPETLLYRLYHEDGVRIFEPSTAHFTCTCRREKIASVLAQYPKETILEMVTDNAIEVVCDFCRTPYRFELDETGQTFKAATGSE